MYFVKLTLRTIIFCLILTSFGNAPITFAQNASDQDATCRGVDLVVLVDQSRSMEQNDPEQLRVNAIRLLIDSLGINVLYDCPSIAHRMAVITFGAASGNQPATATLIDTITISPSLEEFTDWQIQRDTHRARIPDLIPIIGGGTDFRSAFEAARQRFNQWQEQPLGAEIRRQSVVLIADGGPCINISGSACFGAGGSQGQYLADLEAYLDANGSNFPWRGNTNQQSIDIWLIALIDTSQTGFNYLSDPGLRQSWQRITDSHAGAFLILDSSRDPNSINQDISKAVAEIADTITGSELIAATCNEPFYVEPYLDRAIIRILKIGSNPNVPLEDVKVSVVYQGPKELTQLQDGRVTIGIANVADYISDGPNEHYVLESPTPGMYEIEVAGADECRDLDVAYKEFDLLGTLLTPRKNEVLAQFNEPPYYDPNEPNYVTFGVYGRRNEEQLIQIVSDPDYPLSLRAEIERPDGTVQPLDLVEANDGIWRSTDPIDVSQDGAYEWRVIGQASSPDPDEGIKTRFENQEQFTVRPVKRFDVEIIEPRAGSIINLNRIDQSQVVYESYEVLVQVRDAETGEIIDGSLLRKSGLSSPFFVTTRNGVQESDELPMLFDPGRQAWFVSITPGRSNVPFLMGEQTVQVSLNADGYQRENYRPSADGGSSAAVQIRRAVQLSAGSIIEPTAPVPQFDVAPFYDADAPVFFRYQIAGYQDENGLAASLPAERLNVNLGITSPDGTVENSELTYTDAGIWKSPTPIRIPDDGRYAWSIKVEARNQQDAQLIRGIEENGQFEVSRVGRYRLEIIAPATGSVYPLNQIVAGTDQEIPLEVRVALIDEETGTELTDAVLNPDVDPSTVLSVTVEGATRATGPIALRYDAVSRAWRASLSSSRGETPDEDGFQTLKVTLAKDAVNTLQYRPALNLNALTSSQFERVLLQPIALRMRSDRLNMPLYAGPTFCYNAGLVALEMQFTVVQANGAQLPLDPSVIASNEVESLAQVVLVDPVSGAAVDEGRLEITSVDGNLALKAIVGENYRQPGNYEIQVIPNNSALSARYQFLDAAPIVIPVSRTSNWLYAPITCQGAGVVSLLSMVGFLFYAGICWVTRPTGVIELVDDRGRQWGGEYRLGASVELLQRKLTLKPIPDPVIGRIEVRRGDPENAVDVNPYGEASRQTTSSLRAVQIVVYDSDGGVLRDETLVSGDAPIPITMDTYLKYT